MCPQFLISSSKMHAHTCRATVQIGKSRGCWGPYRYRHRNYWYLIYTIRRSGNPKGEKAYRYCYEYVKKNRVVVNIYLYILYTRYRYCVICLRITVFSYNYTLVTFLFVVPRRPTPSSSSWRRANPLALAPLVARSTCTAARTKCPPAGHYHLSV